MSKIRNRLLRHTAGKYCRPSGSNKKHRLVYDIEVITQLSEVYGTVTLIYIDGERDIIAPRKHMAANKDIEAITIQDFSLLRKPNNPINSEREKSA